jgi:hypothetical protein
MKSSLKILAFLMVLPFLLHTGTALYGQEGSGHVLISPALKTAQISDTFSIFAGIDTVNTVKDFLIDIEVDTNIIRMDSCKKVSSFFTGPNGSFVYWKDTLQHFSDGDSAYVYEIQGSIFGPGNFVDGPGNFVSMKFTALDYGLSPVTFRYYELRDTLVDPETHIGQLIELEGALDGTVIICPEGQPLLFINNRDLSFLAESGQDNPPPQSFNIEDPCLGNMDWTATEMADWFSLDSYAGSAPSIIEVSVDISGLGGGNYLDSILVEAPGAENSPGYVRVSLDLIGSSYVCGDANGDGKVNVSDAVYIINYVFIGGDPPNPIESGDANCDGSPNVSDAVYIINFVFIGGNAPCDPNGDGMPDC